MKGAGAKCSLYARYRCGLSGLNTYLVCSSCFAAVPFISACRKAALLEADSADVGVTRACSGPSATDLCTKSLWRGCEQKTIYVYDSIWKEDLWLICDASPGRWGRVLMKKRERLLADASGIQCLLWMRNSMHGFSCTGISYSRL